MSNRHELISNILVNIQKVMTVFMLYMTYPFCHPPTKISHPRFNNDEDRVASEHD